MKNAKKLKKILGSIAMVIALVLCVIPMDSLKANASEITSTGTTDSGTVDITIDNTKSRLKAYFYPDQTDMSVCIEVEEGKMSDPCSVKINTVGRLRLCVTGNGYSVRDGEQEEMVPNATSVDGLMGDNYGDVRVPNCRAAYTVTADETKTIAIVAEYECHHPSLHPTDCGDGTHAGRCSFCMTEIKKSHTLTEMTATEYADSEYEGYLGDNLSTLKNEMISGITSKLGVDANTKINVCKDCGYTETIKAVDITIDNSVSHLAVRFYPNTNDTGDNSFEGVDVGAKATFSVPKGSVARIRLYVQGDGYCLPDGYVVDGATKLENDDRVNRGWCRAAYEITADAAKTITIPEAAVCTHPYADPNVRWGYYNRGDGTHAQSCTLCSVDIPGTIANHTFKEMTATEYADWYYNDSNFAGCSAEDIAAWKADMIAYVTGELGIDANTKMKACTMCEYLEKIVAVTPETEGWVAESGVRYWYEDGVKQGTEGRGKEIYDPASDAWYWLDAVDGGKMATGKDVYQESLAGQWGDYIGADGERYGKWVRYDENGRMVKGWSGDYYFDQTYGTMAKGFATIDGVEYYFDPATGVLQYTVGEVPQMGWKTIDGKQYWYENYIRQGYSVDASYRGKEIYDPASDEWYWLDNIQGGAMATSKDVYQESLAGDWGESCNASGEKTGKWVRYDANGQMIKGWSNTDAGTYYFDEIYGTMAKGNVVIEGNTYYFDEVTGVLQ